MAHLDVESISIDGNDVATGKQETLVSGTNIKTIEGQSILGSGNIDLTKTDVGLANVDNTTDLLKPISTATQNALNLKANLASPTFTGTVSGINKTMVGLGNVVNLDTSTTSNITDSLNKRFITDAQQTVLGNTSGSNSGDNATNTTSNSYADSKVEDALVNGVTTKAPSQNIVFDALALKQDSLGFTAENTVNKTDVVTGNETSSIKFLSVKGVFDWVSSLFVQKNATITGATKTKITYDSKGLVTTGADATTADIADSLNKRYVTDANLTTIGNTSGTNSGNETVNTIGSLVNGSTVATPNDTDLIPNIESSVMKKITWTNIKAFLKTYFDTLYQDVLQSGTNIKTINGSSILGSGDLVVSAVSTNQTAMLTTIQTTTSNGIPTLLTGFTFTVPAGKTMFLNSILIYTTAATSTGCKHAIRIAHGNGANGNAQGSVFIYSNINSAPSNTGVSDGDNFNLAGNFNLEISILATSATTGNNSSHLQAIIKNTSSNVNTTVTIEFASEVNGSAVNAQIGTAAFASIN